MKFVNLPEKAPLLVTHKKFYSKLVNCDVGYNIYLPPDYQKSCCKRYPVVYHLHGYKGHESSDIWALEKVYKSCEAITVFVNGGCGYIDDYNDGEAPIEMILITELIPHIDAQYRTVSTRGGRSLTGWSMGGAGAFYYSVKYLELFHAVTAYAGTYHHFYYSGYRGVGEPLEKAAELYEKMVGDDKCFDCDDVLKLRQKADKIRESLHIALQVGTVDPLICDNEIWHLYLDSLGIPH